MNRRVIYTVITMLLCSSLAFAQSFKLEEKSSKKQPSWIANLERNYITSTASAESIDAAQQGALLGVKQQIAQSIASNVSVDLLQSFSTVDVNGSSTYEARNEDIIRSTTEKIPFLQSISLSKASDFYWEKYYDKKSKITRYDYYIKYHFPSTELLQLVDEFNAEQADINAIVRGIEREINTFSQVENIEESISKLKALFSRLSESDPRVTQIDELIVRYRNQYNNISFKVVEHENKRAVIQLMLNSRMLSTAQIPNHKANCADRITKRIEDGCVVIDYDDYMCRAGEDNWIELTFKFGLRFTSTKIHILK